MIAASVPELTILEAGRVFMAAPKNRFGSSFNAWHAVSVVPGFSACMASQKIGAMRFLPAQAPRIPLADCTTPLTCRCVYRHHADRRAGARRAIDRGMYRLHRGDDRRRTPRGRRAEDH
jgi:hypothetical protein